MRKKIFSFLLLLGFFLIPTALAANSQGLTWGVTEEQEIQYTLHVVLDVSTPYTTTMDETYTIIYTIQHLPTIPDSVDSTMQLVYATGSMTFENGSTIASLPVSSVPVSFLVLPIGNWDHLDTIFKESASGSPYEITWTNDLSNWGFSYTTDMMGDVTMTLLFSKSDGAASLIDYALDMGAAGSMEITFTRIGAPMDTTMILIIGGGVAAILIIGIVFWKVRS